MSDITAPAPRVALEEIPEWEARELAKCLYESVLRFFEVPENQAKFEKWKAEQYRKAAMEAAK